MTTATALPRMTRFGRAETPFGYVVNQGPGAYAAFTTAGILLGRYSRKSDAFAGEMTPAAELRVMVADLLGYDVITIQNLNGMNEAELFQHVDEMTTPAV